MTDTDGAAARQVLRWMMHLTVAASVVSPTLACQPHLVLQTSAPPLPSGTIIFQGGNGNAAELYLFETVSHLQTNLTRVWPLIYSPRNAHVSADGQNVVFTAISCPGVTHRNFSCTQAQSARTDAFLWHVGSSGLIGLTTGLTNQRYEDVIFTADDSGVLLKQAGQLAAYTLDYSNQSAPALGAQRTLPALPLGEASGPYPTYDNQGFYVWLNSGNAAVVYDADYAGGSAPANAPGASSSYFPVASANGAAFLVAHDGHTTRGGALVDQIFMQAPGGSAFSTIAANMCTADNSDPAPVNPTLLLFSNDHSGAYLPFLTDLSTGKLWSLKAKIGLGSGIPFVLGMSFTASHLAPP